MFNRSTLRITRHVMAITAVTIVVALAARTTSAYALAPVAQPAPRFAAPFAPASPSRTYAGRALWPDPLHNSQTTCSYCSGRRNGPAHTRPISTRSRLRAAVA